MCVHPKPLTVCAIFARPGRNWTPDERTVVIEWLHQDEQLDRLLEIADWNLGRFNQPGEAEEAWADFFVDRLDNVILSYDPAAEGAVCFWRYCGFCFRRFCWDRAYRRGNGESILRPTGPRGLPDGAAGSWASPADEASWKEIAEILKAGIEAMPERYRTAFVLHVVEGWPLDEVAREMKVSYQTAANLVFRAKRWLRRWLDKNHPGLG